MKVLKVYPQEVGIQLEFRLSELKLLKKALDNSTINVSTEVPGSMEASQYVTETFYPEIARLIEEFSDGS